MGANNTKTPSRARLDDFDNHRHAIQNVKMNLPRALLSNSVDAIRKLIHDGANVNAKIVCFNGSDRDVCECDFIDKKKSQKSNWSNTSCFDGQRPIAIAARRRDVSAATLQCLIACGAAVDDPDRSVPNDSQPLAIVSDVAKASLLLNAGADTKAAYFNRDRQVLLHFLASVGLANVDRSIIHSAMMEKNKAATAFLLIPAIGDEVDRQVVTRRVYHLLDSDSTGYERHFEKDFLKLGDLMFGEFMAAFGPLRLEFTRRRIVEICIGMQDANWPALQTLMLIDVAVPNAHLLPMKTKWDLIVAVKHFRASVHGT